QVARLAADRRRGPCDAARAVRGEVVLRPGRPETAGDGDAASRRRGSVRALLLRLPPGCRRFTAPSHGPQLRRSALRDVRLQSIRDGEEVIDPGSRTLMRSRMVLIGAACCLAAAGMLAAQESFTTVTRDVNRKLVKLFGAGGFKGLPSYGTGVLVSP